MEEKLNAAIERTLDQIKSNNNQPDNALKFSQAALNLIQARQILEVNRKPAKA